MQIKPEIDLLAQVNIKKKQYEKMLEEYDFRLDLDIDNKKYLKRKRK